MKSEKFTAIILEGHKRSACEIPFDPAKRWQSKPQPLWPGRRGYRVRGTLNGAELEGVIVGRSRKFYVLVDTEAKQAAGVNSGDKVNLTLQLNDRD